MTQEAKSLRDYMQEIYDQHGQLTPALVVETARPEDSPLHAMVFNKTTEEAAEAYFLNRAQELITRVRIRYRDSGGRESEVRKWHAVRTEQGMAYKPAEEVAADPFLSRLLLQEAEREWKALYSRFRHLEEFIEMVKGALEDDAA